MLIPFFFVLALGASWGVHFPLLRFIAEQGYDFTNIITFVVAGVASILTIICLARKRMPDFSWPAIRYYFLCGVTGYLLPFCFELFSAPKVGAGVLAIIVTLTPIFTVILTVAVRAEVITRKKMLAVVFGLLAVLPLFNFSEIQFGSAYGLGLLVALLVPICYSAYYIFVMKLWPDGMDSWQVAAGESLACAAIIIPIMLASGNTDIGFLQDRESLATVIMMICMSVAEVYLYFEVIRRAGVVFVSQTNFVAVVMSVILGMIFFGEEHGLWIIACMILLAASLALSAKETTSKA